MQIKLTSEQRDLLLNIKQNIANTMGRSGPGYKRISDIISVGSYYDEDKYILNDWRNYYIQTLNNKDERGN